MTGRENTDGADLIAGALEWWRDAGVDFAFADEPAVWSQPDAPPTLEEPPAPIGQQPADADRISAEPPIALRKVALDAMPAGHPQFLDWWMKEPALAEGALATRVAPRGRTGAELMVLVPEPEADDRESLLSGPQGRLLDAMLAAFGVEQQDCYIASALPRHLPGADWAALNAMGMGEIVAHHIALVAPKRLIMFGASVLSLIGNGPPQGPADLRFFNHVDERIPLLACRSLAALLEQPRWKSGIWRAWLDWGH